ncbi:Protein vip1 [Savitreella phatthalungensis]
MSKVTASNISLDVTQPQIKQFFSFCGRISDISVRKAANHQTAHITFERASAAKTALLLQDAVLGLDKIKIESDSESSSSADASTSDDRDLAAHEDGSDVPQEQKPRTTIIAEYLSHGYVLGDSAVSKSMEFDKAHGISERFYSLLQSAQQRAQEVDNKLKVTDKLQEADAKYNITQTAQQQASSLYASFQRYLDTGAGNKVRSFYSDLVGSAMDVHSEARRLADLRQGNGVISSSQGVINPAEAGAHAPGGTSTTQEKPITAEDVPKLGATSS